MIASHGDSSGLNPRLLWVLFMDFLKLVESLTPEAYEALKRGVELGKWPDGRKLTSDQKKICMQAIMLHEQRKPSEERSGFMPKKKNCFKPPRQQKIEPPSQVIASDNA